MIPKENEKIVVVFKTGIQIEGIVVNWTDKKTVLKSLAGTTTIVINNTDEDILFYKLVPSTQEYEKLKEIPKKELPDIKKMAELKIELNELEKAEIADKLRSHQADGARKIHYGLPFSNIKIEGTVKRTGEKTTSRDTEVTEGLQDLFAKKY